MRTGNATDTILVDAMASASTAFRLASHTNSTTVYSGSLTNIQHSNLQYINSTRYSEPHSSEAYLDTIATDIVPSTVLSTTIASISSSEIDGTALTYDMASETRSMTTIYFTSPASATSATSSDISESHGVRIYLGITSKHKIADMSSQPCHPSLRQLRAWYPV